jgi:uncharacterized membrane protein (DUF2068 family)
MKPSASNLLRMIAVFKFLKALLMIIVGVGALRLVHMDITALFEHLVRHFGLDPGGRYVGAALQKAANLTPDKITSIGVGSFVYAALFLTEGIGLWLKKRWAEYFTVILTATLVPVEIYELIRHPSVAKVFILLVNLAIVGFLIYVIRHKNALEPPAASL